MKQTKQSLHRQANPISLFALFMAVLIFFPIIETRYFPVTGPLHITSIRPVDDGVMVSGWADKLRECRWRRTEWFLGERGKMNVPVAGMEYRERPRVNGIGRIYWDSIFVPLSASETLELSFSNAIHSCWGGALDRMGYETKTHYWR